MDRAETQIMRREDFRGSKTVMQMKIDQIYGYVAIEIHPSN